MWNLRSLFLTLILFLTTCVAVGGPFGLFERDPLPDLNKKLHGKVLDFTHNHGEDRRVFSPALNAKRDIYVYIPPGYDPAERYPLVIWLHGIAQDEENFLNIIPVFDTAIAKGELPPFILVAPDGSIHGKPSRESVGSFYVNSLAGNFEDYIAIDVWNFVVKRFAIRPEREAHMLAGASMGGFGAYNLAIKHRDRFAHVAGIMPALNTRYTDCRGRNLANFDPCCFDFIQELDPNRVVGRYGCFLKVYQKQLTEPLFGNAPDAIYRAAKENPVEMLYTYDVKPDELNMFVCYGDKDQFNIDAQAESFVYLANKKGIKPRVCKIPDGKHDSETGIRAFPELVKWGRPLLEPYAPKYPPCR